MSMDFIAVCILLLIERKKGGGGEQKYTKRQKCQCLNILVFLGMQEVWYLYLIV